MSEHNIQIRFYTDFYSYYDTINVLTLSNLSLDKFDIVPGVFDYNTYYSVRNKNFLIVYKIDKLNDKIKTQILNNEIKKILIFNKPTFNENTQNLRSCALVIKITHDVKNDNFYFYTFLTKGFYENLNFNNNTWYNYRIKITISDHVKLLEYKDFLYDDDNIYKSIQDIITLNKESKETCSTIELYYYMSNTLKCIDYDHDLINVFINFINDNDVAIKQEYNIIIKVPLELKFNEKANYSILEKERDITDDSRKKDIEVLLTANKSNKITSDDDTTISNINDFLFQNDNIKSTFFGKDILLIDTKNNKQYFNGNEYLSTTTPFQFKNTTRAEVISNTAFNYGAKIGKILPSFTRPNVQVNAAVAEDKRDIAKAKADLAAKTVEKNKMYINMAEDNATKKRDIAIAAKAEADANMADANLQTMWVNAEADAKLADAKVEEAKVDLEDAETELVAAETELAAANLKRGGNNISNKNKKKIKKNITLKQ